MKNKILLFHGTTGNQILLEIENPLKNSVIGKKGVKHK